MEYQGLLLGICMAFGVFALKSGAGLSYAIAARQSVWQKWRLFLAYQFGYVVLFCIAAFAVLKIDLLNYSDTLQSWLKSGMTIHYILAGLMAAWGIYLLAHRHQNNQAIYLTDSCNGTGSSRGWFILAIPCPVCLTVIVFSLAISKTLYPDRFLGLSGLILAIFLILNTITTFGLLSLKKMWQMHPEHLLGKMMIATAVYFLLTVAVSPAFSEVESVYKLASSSPTAANLTGMSGVQFGSVESMISLSLLCIAFTCGFLKAFYLSRRLS